MRPFTPLVLLLLFSLSVLRSAEAYTLGPDSLPQPKLPRGEIRTGKFADSKIFPGTTRDYFVYVPEQYDPAKPACLMVFFDGAGFFKADGAFRIATVFDNLIAKKDTPVIIAVGVNPGVVAATAPGAKDRNNRSFEYDSLGDTNARFLLEELLPAALAGLNVTADPAARAVVGNSSGGIAAFTVAWERPDSFRKVVSHIGSFTNIRGGYVYPGLIRKSKTAPKPLRVFLQDGANDLDNLHGNWPLTNQDMAAALKFAGYDQTFVLGTEGHNGKHGGAIFPDTLRWLWRDWSKN
ncbi:MAG: esterase [Opitutia bacterium]|nr:MAG: esterase [Opitutae bacterium]